MFVGMEQGVLTWKEFLSEFKKGQSEEVKPENVKAAYSAINDLKGISPEKKFGIRTHPSTLKKRVIRIK